MLLILMTLIAMPFVIAEGETSTISLGTFQMGEEIELLQTCNNATALCDYCVISSIKYPNSSIMFSNLGMTNRTYDFNYTIQPDKTTIIGMYLVNGFCESGDERKVWSYDFKINVTGEELSLSQIIIIFGQVAILAMFLILGFAFAKKHWKIKTFFWMMALLMGVIVLNSIRIIASESSRLDTMWNVGIILGIVTTSVMFLYFFILATIEIIVNIKEKRGVRWDYGQSTKE